MDSFEEIENHLILAESGDEEIYISIETPAFSLDMGLCSIRNLEIDYDKVSFTINPDKDFIINKKEVIAISFSENKEYDYFIQNNDNFLCIIFKNKSY